MDSQEYLKTEKKKKFRDVVREFILSISTNAGSYLGFTGANYLDIKQWNSSGTLIDSIDSIESNIERSQSLLVNLAEENPELLRHTRIFKGDFKNTCTFLDAVQFKDYSVIYLDTESFWSSIDKATIKLINQYYNYSSQTKTCFVVAVTERNKGISTLQADYSSSLDEVKNQVKDKGIYTEASVDALFDYLQNGQPSTMDIYSVLVPYEIIFKTSGFKIECVKIVQYFGTVTMCNFIFTLEKKEVNTADLSSMIHSIKNVPLDDIYTIDENPTNKQMELQSYSSKMPKLIPKDVNVDAV